MRGQIKLGGGGGGVEKLRKWGKDAEKIGWYVFCLEIFGNATKVTVWNFFRPPSPPHCPACEIIFHTVAIDTRLNEQAIISLGYLFRSLEIITWLVLDFYNH